MTRALDRVGLIHVWQEVNTFSPRPTVDADFDAHERSLGAQLLGRHRGTRSIVGGFLTADRFEPVPVYGAQAWPAGPPARAVASRLLDELDQQLSGAGPLDGALLSLHGAMVAEGWDDMDGEIVRRVRAHIGDGPIACVLDLHGLPSDRLVELADVVIAFRTYPHVDQWERGREAAALMAEMLGGRRLRTVLRRVPLLSCPLAQNTAEDPMRELFARADSRARQPIHSISLLPGFPYADVERAGFAVLATGDDAHADRLRQAADETAGDVERFAAAFALTRENPQAAVARALAHNRTPVVLADTGDNIGGGGAGDGTALLRELLEQGATGAVVMLSDAEVALRSAKLGAGARIAARVGGKLDDRHGRPVPIEGRITTITDGSYVSRGPYLTGQRFSMGTTARIKVAGLEVVVTERATPPFHVEQLTSVGINPRRARVIALKGAVAWRGAYEGLVGEIIEVDTPGACPIDLSQLPRRQWRLDNGA